MSSPERLGLLGVVLAICLPIIFLMRAGRIPWPERPAEPVAAAPAAKPVEELPPDLRIDPAELEAIRDNTLDRPEENRVLIRLLSILKRADPQQLQRASIGRVTYAQLQRQPNQYRGKLVSISGTVRRANRLHASKNDQGIETFWQLWLQPTDAPDWPVVVECLELPAGFPTGLSLAEDAAVTGFFFKRWAYLAQDQLRTAPTLLARTIQWDKPPQPAQNPVSRDWTSAVIVGVGIAVIGLWMATRFRRRPPRGPERDETRPDFSRLGAILFLCATACSQAVPAAPPETGRQLLAQFGIEPKQLDTLVDGRPLGEEETLTLLRVLYRGGGRPAKGKESFEIATFPLVQVERLARHDADRVDFAKSSAGLRGEFFELRGQVVEVEPVKVAAALVDRFDFGEYYRCRLLVDQSRGGRRDLLVVYARDVPEAWRKGAKPNQRGGAIGAYLKTLPGGQGPLFAARRVAWYPDTPLGRLGMDAGLLDDLQDRKSLGRSEQEAFYQLLAAVASAKPGELMRQADAELRAAGQESSSAVPMFNEPWTQRGRLVALSGTARRAIKIFIDDPEIAARFGLDHYYELGLFTGDSQDNPLVICAPELPAGMPAGEDYRYTEQIRVAGFFYKVWAYRSSRMDGGKPVAQLAPLVVAQTPVWVPSPQRGRTPTGPVSTGLLIAGLVFAAWLTWRFMRTGRKRL